MGFFDFILGLFGRGKPRSAGQQPFSAPDRSGSPSRPRSLEQADSSSGHAGQREEISLKSSVDSAEDLSGNFREDTANSSSVPSITEVERISNSEPVTVPSSGPVDFPAGVDGNAAIHREGLAGAVVQFRRIRGRRRSPYAPLVRLRRKFQHPTRAPLSELTVPQAPYPFARMGVLGGYYDLSRDGNSERLQQLGLPLFQNPVELAAWLELPVGRVAWLVHRCEEAQRPHDVRSAHYHFRWARKRSGGHRLIEAPKPLLKSIQRKVLREILDRVPVHTACHGFVVGRSIRTNATPHTGQRVVVKLDLENFYSTVSYSRVVAIFRSLGYSREAAIWLGGLTTSAIPANLDVPNNNLALLNVYRGRHLPQGAPTSPALANLSAFSLDLRLSGLARSFQSQYTRYADDLTFSGPRRFLFGLAIFLQLVDKIVKAERFRLHPVKRHVVRSNQQQKITGVVVNERVNVDRAEYDRIKALLCNCVRHGARSQNREQHADFAQQVLGRIGHVKHLNPARGAKLLELFRRVDWKT